MSDQPYLSRPEQATKEIAPDDLPAGRLGDALALARFLRFLPIRHFICGSYSARVALDMEAIGIIRLRREWDGQIEMLEIVRGDE